MSLRVVIVTRIPPVFLGFHQAVLDAGHEPVALLTLADESPFVPELFRSVPAGLDVLMPGTRSAVAPLLEAVRPDLVLCMGFPWKIPAEALAVPRLGWLNGHPSQLPRHRGPVPIAWAIRNGDEDIGISFHFMDADLDTGPVVARASMPLGDWAEPEELYGRLAPVIVETLGEALRRIETGERGTVQPDGGEYETFFSASDVWLDPALTASELYRLVWAWHFTIPYETERGPLVDLDGETVRVLRASLEPVEDAARFECSNGPLWLVTTEPLVSPPTA